MRKSKVEGKSATSPARLRCAMYTRKSTEEGLDQEFNSLAAQREASEAFILSQRREGWLALPDRYDDGGFTGANMDRPALGRLLQAVGAGELRVEGARNDLKGEITPVQKWQSCLPKIFPVILTMVVGG